MLRLKSYLEGKQVSQADLARSIGISRAAMTNLLNRGSYPVKRDSKELAHAIEKTLQAKGIPTSKSLFGLNPF